MSLAYSLSTHRLQGGLFIDPSLLFYIAPLFLSLLPFPNGLLFLDPCSYYLLCIFAVQIAPRQFTNFSKCGLVFGFISEASLRPDVFPSWGTVSSATDYKNNWTLEQISMTDMYKNFIRFQSGLRVFLSFEAQEAYSFSLPLEGGWIV